MRVAALVLIAIFGFVNGQQNGNARYNPDRGFTYGGGYSQGGTRYGNTQKDRFGPAYANNNGYGNTFLDNNPLGGYPRRQQMQGQGNGVNHQNVGNAPARGSSGQMVPDYPQFVNNQPATNNVNHVNAGAQPQADQGGSSNGQGIIPLGPVQTGMTDQVNMQNAGSPPEQGNNPNSGENFDNYNWGAPVGGVAANGATGDMQPVNPALPAAPLGGQETVLGQQGGYSGQQQQPLGGAQISDFTQKEAGKPAHSTGGASVGGATAGVVIAVLVLVGIVGVAAVFLIKQRRSRMTMQQV